MVDSVEESDDDSSSSSSKIKTKSDYFGSLLRGGGKKTKMKVVHATQGIDQVSSLCHITFV